MTSVEDIRRALTDLSHVNTVGGSDKKHRVYQIKFFVTQLAQCVGLSEKASNIASRFQGRYTKLMNCAPSKLDYIGKAYTAAEHDFVKVGTAYCGNAQALRYAAHWLRSKNYQEAINTNWEVVFDAVNALIKELQIHERQQNLVFAPVVKLEDVVANYVDDDDYDDIKCSSEDCESPQKKRARTEEEPKEGGASVSAFREKIGKLHAPLVCCVKHLEDVVGLIKLFNKPQSLSKLSFSLTRFIDVIFPPVYEEFTTTYAKKLPPMPSKGDDEIEKCNERKKWCEEMYEQMKQNEQTISEVLHEIDDDMSTPKFPATGNVLANYEAPYYEAKMKLWTEKLAALNFTF